MSFSPRPCPHCRGTSFHVIPGMQVAIRCSPAMYGVAADAMMMNARMTFTLVACTQCGRSETFTNDIAKVASHYPQAQVITTTRTD